MPLANFRDIVKVMRLVIIGGTILVVAGATLLFVFTPKTVIVAPSVALNASVPSVISTSTPLVLPAIPEAPPPPISPQQAIMDSGGVKPSNDLPNQPHLADPPEVAKGIYVTAWTAGSPTRMQALINLIKRTELNTVVIDIKDYSGYVSYHTGISEIAATGAENEIRIVRPNTLIKTLHDAGIYVIGRITDFQDPILAKAHPEWAMHNKATGKVWTDNKGLAWMDPAAPGARNYLLMIAKDASARGFDELQFDYIRFASDGSIGNISYPYWDQKTSRAKVIADYFKFLREGLPDEKISVDLFGLATYDNWDDLGIGQVIEGAYQYFDYVSPMVYPSHYAAGSLGYKNPAAYPYEIIKYSMDHALTRLISLENKESGIMNNASSTATSTQEIHDSSFVIHNSKLRPWLQDFNLGAVYDASMVKKEIQATYDSLLNVTSTREGHYGGWLLWSAANTYTTGALGPK